MNIKTYRKFGAVVASSALLATVVAPVSAQTPDVGQNPAYTDVPKDYTHYPSILEARMLGILSGYGDGIFKPYQSLTRANVVKALGKYVVEISGKEIGDFDLTEVEPFNDVQSDYPDEELYTYSLIVKQAGIFKGSNNNLMPTSLIQRQQMAQVLVNAFELADFPDKESSVEDNDAAWKDFRESIDILSVNGVTTEENFRPSESTTRGQFASFLVRAYKVSEGLDPKKLYPAPIVSVENPAEIIITVGETPELPDTVEATLESGVETDVTVEWDTNSLNTEEVGSYTLTGNVSRTELTAAVKVTVKEPTYTEVATFGGGDNVIVISRSNLSESALNPLNYKFNDGPLPSGTKIKKGDGGGVIITLPKPKEIIPEDIPFTLEITQNVKTNDGEIITGNAFDRDFEEVGPVNASVTSAFHDNVAPTLVSAHYVVPSADSETADWIQLTFSEGMAPVFYDMDAIDPEDSVMMEFAGHQNMSNIVYIMDDLIFKVNGTEIGSVPSFIKDDIIISNEKIYLSIPPMSINQSSTITIVPEGENNERLMITDDSLGKNSVVAPVTKTLTYDDVVVMDPEVEIEPDLIIE